MKWQALTLISVMMFLSVASYSCGLYHTELAKQDGEVARACVTAGNEWVYPTFGQRECRSKK